MDYVTMEVQNLIDCFEYCKKHLLETIQEEKHNILMFEDRQNSTSNIMVVIVKQERTNARREHIVLNAVLRLTVMTEPKVGFCRYFTITGTHACFVIF